MYVQKKLESNKVTIPLILPLIWDLRTSLRDMLSDLREPAPNKDEANVLQAWAMLLPCEETCLL